MFFQVQLNVVLMLGLISVYLYTKNLNININYITLYAKMCSGDGGYSLKVIQRQ